MSQLLKKCALLAACAALALCFTTRSAHAQTATVSSSGTGEHLIFAYWSVENYTDTLVSINNPLGVRDDTTDEMNNVVHVVVRDTMGMAQTSFNICLTPGGSWTAVISKSGLSVGTPGGCDDAVQQIQPSRSNPMPTTTPMKGDMVPLEAMSGYLEAWLRPNGSLMDGDDEDALPENADPKGISGSATLVSAMSGFSSTYNATALIGCGDTAGSPIAAAADDGDGCWGEATAQGATADGAPITAALTAENKDLLTGRWTAINDEKIMSHTKVVLTFPVNHLSHTVVTDNADDEAGTDPVSIHAFNDMGQIALSNHKVMLGMNVNMCKFMNAGMDMGNDMDMGGDMDMGNDMDRMPMLSCNDMEVGELNGMAGAFRIFNNNADTDADPDTEGIQISGENADPGTEAMDLSIADDSNTVTDGEQPGGQKAAEALNAIGLNFSYFMGTDGNQYDQVTPVQWIDIGDFATQDDML